MRDQYEPLHTERWGTDHTGARRALLLPGITSSAARGLLVDPALLVPDDVIDGLVPELQRDQAAQTDAVVAAAHPHWHPRTVAERVRSTRTTDVVAVGGYAAQNRPWDVRDQARAVGVPVHVLVPSDEPVMTSSVVNELSAVTRPRWSFETVPDTTHSVHRDRPALVVDRAVRPAGGSAHVC